MNHKITEQGDFPAVILATLAKLDEKGCDDKVTQAMTIVFEAFRMRAAGQ